jgi:hypothetical protein
MRPRATAVEPLEDFLLLVTFNNNETKIFDVKPYFEFKPFQAIQTSSAFKTVHISGLSVGWKNGVDICPDELYYDSVPVQ